MELAVICFTKGGYKQMKNLEAAAKKANLHLYGESLSVSVYCKCSALAEKCACSYVQENIGAWTAWQFAKGNALLFIGAMGIAVRAAGALAENKLTDSPVLVMDEAGQFVIPVLSGHVGGANSLARQIAELTGAKPVITTATDVNQTFSVDVFARENDLRIVNKDGIAPVSAKLLSEGTITIALDAGMDADVYVGEQSAGSRAKLNLEIRPYVLGIGCKKGKTKEEIADFVQKRLAEAGISLAQVGQIASIDVKAEEIGLLAFAKEQGLRLRTFSAAELEAVPGRFTESAFVKEQVGVGSVCERAAMAACGGDGELILRKQGGNGITVAAAKRRVKLRFE